jgi:membrane-associated protease RseP (regulator of RpoE activity)
MAVASVASPAVSAPGLLPSPSVRSVPTGLARTVLGVRTLPIDSVTQERFQLTEPAGAYVIGVVHDLPASRAGVPPGSVIVAIDNRPVRSPNELTALVTGSPVDRPVTLRFVLPGGEAKQASVVLEPIPAPLERALMGDGGSTLDVGSSGRMNDAGSQPRMAQRPLDLPVVSLESETQALRRELLHLRARLEAMERRLETPASGVVP